jgi:hypothetical protein
MTALMVCRPYAHLLNTRIFLSASRFGKVLIRGQWNVYPPRYLYVTEVYLCMTLVATAFHRFLYLYTSVFL